MGTNWEAQSRNGQSCFLSPTASWSESEMHRRVTGCLRPVRDGSYPQRAIFLVGDSHAGSIAPALMAAFNGAVSLVWTAIGGGCGYVSDRGMRSVFDAIEEMHKYPLCSTYNEAVRPSLSSSPARSPRAACAASPLSLRCVARHCWIDTLPCRSTRPLRRSCSRAISWCAPSQTEP